MESFFIVGEKQKKEEIFMTWFEWKMNGRLINFLSLRNLDFVARIFYMEHDSHKSLYHWFDYKSYFKITVHFLHCWLNIVRKRSKQKSLLALWRLYKKKVHSKVHI